MFEVLLLVGLGLSQPFLPTLIYGHDHSAIMDRTPLKQSHFRVWPASFLSNHSILTFVTYHIFVFSDDFDRHGIWCDMAKYIAII